MNSQTEPNQFLETLSEGLGELQVEMRAMNLSRNIRIYSGGSDFKGWVKDMEKAGALVQMNDNRMKMLALQTLAGSAADFCVRFLKTHNNCSWDELTEAMAERYCDTADVQVARMRLRQLVQEKGEPVQLFADKIIELASEAYTAAELATGVVQSQLKDIFIDGLKDNHTFRRLISARPEDLTHAVRLATRMQADERACHLRRPEPMEVDAIKLRSSSPDRLYRRQTQVELLAKGLEQVMSISSISTSKPVSKADDPQWMTMDGRPICRFCKKVGHLKRDCYAKKRKDAQNQGNGSTHN
jgi:hypothetical protein